MDDRFSMEGGLPSSPTAAPATGRASALVLVEHGADTVLTGRCEQPLEATATEIGARGGRLVTPTDVTDAEIGYKF